MRKIIGTLLFVAFTLTVFGQTSEDLPSDFLGKDFHKQRRQALRDKLPPNSVAVLFANAVRNRSNDVDYIYHQDPNFYYLTGYREPDAVLLIFKDKQTANNGAKYDEIIFVQPRDITLKCGMKTPRVRRCKKTLGLIRRSTILISKYNVDFQKFDAILLTISKMTCAIIRWIPLIYTAYRKFKQKANYPSRENLNVAWKPRQIT